MSGEMNHTGGGNKRFYQVYNQKLRYRVQEGTPESLERVNKLGKQVFEKETIGIFGKIQNITLEDSDYGKQLKIELDPNEDGVIPVLTVGVESKNGRDLLKKLPAVNFGEEVRIMPYKVSPKEGGDDKTGMSLTQKDNEGKYTVKIENFFFDPATKKYTNGYPSLDWDNASEAEQKIYKIQRDDFLVKYLADKVLPQFQDKSHVLSGEFQEDISYPDEVSPEDIPF